MPNLLKRYCCMKDSREPWRLGRFCQGLCKMKLVWGRGRSTGQQVVVNFMNDNIMLWRGSANVRNVAARLDAGECDLC